VKIRFRGTEGARIVAPDGRVLGQVPTELELPRGDQALELRFEAKRHLAEKRAVDVSRDAEVTVELRPKKRQGGAGPGEGDIPPF
jgi:hypothetical protein